MSWNSNIEVHCMTNGYPYSTASFMEYFEGLTYDHVNFIFSGPSHSQETVCPATNSSYYKFEHADSWSASCFDTQSFEVQGHESAIDEHRMQQEFSTVPDEQSLGNRAREENVNPDMASNSMECPRRHSNYHEYQTIWQDIIDPDNMTYEELVDLGETVGSQSRGLSQELIALLPVSKFKCWLFSRKKSRTERCVICQMNYKYGDQRITLPCKHKYHTSCGSKWLSINKACPICYTEVFGDISKR
ncbi:E3 ubiquitin ligase BIG BROTHER-like [Cucurbita pepo subsp. pepo]|uniref:E3 ubiquitin ligase BIG BROTHER-like n=1 Tax=Cucurbita pepo subsp. pepo TaxID=3664 RepID=UPI000C9D41DA|nr:E3 ubiquitin ligase BIG BROTHER-like [Cucurbita pepo subsp. pepo]XP_023532671.1 E3 ubiquitin ligase BIG BROTHER-like [Cucurbita pepo subsp. pepo]XP_023532672.1 E3 ubiquitin ligase BIG BROTHER-like [Cucurbita pepo subsp. pepo]